MSVFPVCLLFLLISCFPRADGLSADDQKKIDLGLTVAKELASLMENKQFTKSLTKIATNIGPYLGAMGPFVGLVMAFIPVEDAVMKQLKIMMENIDNRFDKVDIRFDDVERKIDWAVVKVNFGQIEQNILAMSRKYEHIYLVPKTGAASASQNFIHNYGPVFQHASTKLYQAVTHKQGNFQEDIATSVMRYTKNDRRETQTFLLGVMKLLIQAVKVELSYYALQKQDTLGKYMKGVWEKQIQDVRKNFEAADRTVMGRYHAQLNSDMMEYSVKNKGQSNKDFSKGLWTVLNSKYYWRNWIVIAYNPTRGWDNHCVHTCGGYIKFSTDGRNFIIASRDNNHGIMDRARAERSMRAVSMKKRVGNWWTGHYNVRREAREIYGDLDKRGACTCGVIRCGNNVWLYFHTKRVKYVNRCREGFYMFMWG